MDYLEEQARKEVLEVMDLTAKERQRAAPKSKPDGESMQQSIGGQQKQEEKRHTHTDDTKFTESDLADRGLGIESNRNTAPDARGVKSRSQYVIKPKAEIMNEPDAGIGPVEKLPERYELYKAKDRNRIYLYNKETGEDDNYCDY